MCQIEASQSQQVGTVAPAMLEEITSLAECRLDHSLLQFIVGY